MKKIKYFIFILFAIISTAFIIPDEGMYPVSNLSKIDFKKAGINLSANQIFNEQGGAISDALVRLGGCTGSFISNEGMIITNHHCVFGTVSSLSTPENNYLRDGFYSGNKEKELSTGMPAKITIKSKDVSIEVLINSLGKYGKERDQVLKTNINLLINKEKQKDSLYTYEISEMFAGKQYVLFTYLTLIDVRIVYVPPRYVGEFGAETDNWEWPRHTGDFSIVRAYIGKDGKPAKYSKDNVPFKPNRFLKINPNGTQENDAVFILGYPGRTFRHQPAAFFDYQYTHFMPQIIDWYTWRIDKMYELSKNNEAKYLSFAGNIKGLANTQKNFKGKIQGLGRTNVLSEKREEDKKMALFANEQSRKNLYGNVIEDITQLYNQRSENANLYFYLQRLVNEIPQIGAGFEAYKQIKEERKIHDFSVFERNYSNINDNALNIESIQYLTEKINESYAKTHQGAVLIERQNTTQITKMYYKSLFSDYQNKVMPAIEKKSKKLFNKKDFFVKMAANIFDAYLESIAFEQNFKAKNDMLLSSYTNLKMEFKNTDFLPDANGTLRFTYGHVKGYSPNDGEYNYPHTTLKGIIEKANSMPDYIMPLDALSIYKNTIVSPILLDKKTGKVVVGLLYDLDTTGGNSGSPVMDADGNLIGVNFDRTYTATINDYAWNESYSRSVAVDIRYVLFVLKYIGNAEQVLEELKIKI